MRMTSVLPHTDVQLELDGESLTIEDVLAVARGGVYAGLAHDAIGRIEAARELKRELIEHEIPIYGVTTGFGGTAGHGPGSPAPWLAVIGAGALVAVGGGLRLRRHGLRRQTNTGV